MDRTACIGIRVASIALACIASTTGCGTLAPVSSGGRAGGTLGAHAWTLPECPSLAAAPQAGVLTGALIATGVDLLLERIAGSLAAAAVADRDGLAYSGIDTRYLYFAHAAHAPGKAEPLAAHAGCVVVAVTDRAGARPGS